MSLKTRLYFILAIRFSAQGYLDAGVQRKQACYVNTTILGLVMHTKPTYYLKLVKEDRM